MITTLGETWKREWLAEGRAEGEAVGRAEGEAVGKTKGIAEAVIRLLVKRFGPLPPPLQTRIQTAELQSLESWFDRAINAPDLSTVFDPPR
jgi:predicted transposase YdaD